MLNFISFFSKCHRLRATVQVRVWCKLFSTHVKRWANSSARKPYFSLFWLALYPRGSDAEKEIFGSVRLNMSAQHQCTMLGAHHLCKRKKNEFQEPGQHYLLEALQYQCKLPLYCLLNKTRHHRRAMQITKLWSTTILLPQRASSLSPHTQTSMCAKWYSGTAGVKFLM